MHADPADVKKAIRSYMIVFGALMAFTLITVAASSLRLTVPFAIAVALVIAAVKGSMVAGVFMHLSNERKIIFGMLALTFVFLIGLLLWPAWGLIDRPKF